MSKQEKVVLMRQTIISLLQATRSRVKETGSKLSPMTQLDLPLALAFPVVHHSKTSIDCLGR